MSDHATVIIAAYRAAQVLPRSLAAARTQRGLRVDIVVADDASDDDTANISQSHPDVTTLRMPQNGGPAAARNRAIEAAQGDWIVVLDADDTMTPDRVANMVALAQKTSADLVLGNFIRVDRDETPIDPGPFLPVEDIDPHQLLTLESYIAANAMTADSPNLGYLKPMFRRAALERYGIQYDETLRNSEDYHIVLALLAAGARVVISPAPDYLYQVAAGSLSHRVAPELIESLLAADDRFEASLGAARTSALTQLLAARRASLVSMLNSEHVLQALKERQFGRALSGLAQHPRCAPRMLRQIREAIENRLVRR